MTTKRFSSLASLLVLSAGLFASNARADDIDKQFWTETAFSLPLDEKPDWTLTLSATLRATQDASRLTDRRVGAAVSKRLNRHASLGGGVVLRRNGPSLNNSTRETRYFANATFQTPLSKRTSLVNRNLLERRDNFPARDVTVYRNRTQINFATPILNTGATPFVAGEFFYDFRVKEWVRTRATVGVTRRFNERIIADLFFLRQIEGGNRRGDFHALGVNLRLSP